MRAAWSLLVATALAVGGCVAKPERVPTVECREADAGIEIGAPLPAQECADVVELVLSRFPVDDPAMGTLILIAAEAMECPDAAEASGIPELADPGVDRCWRLHRDYETNSVLQYATRDADTGEVTLHP